MFTITIYLVLASLHYQNLTGLIATPNYCKTMPILTYLLSLFRICYDLLLKHQVKCNAAISFALWKHTALQTKWHGIKALLEIICDIECRFCSG